MRVERSLEQTKAGLRFKETKTDRIREVPLPKSALQVLNTHYEEQEQHKEHFGASCQNNGLIFCTPEGAPLHPDSVSSAVSALFKRLKMKGSLHSLRHTYGSQMIANGVPIPLVSKLLGHPDIATTMRVYAHVIGNQEREGVEKWEEFQHRSLKGAHTVRSH